MTYSTEVRSHASKEGTLDILLVDGDESYLGKLKTMLLHDSGTKGDMKIAQAVAFDDALAKLGGNGFDACFIDSGDKQGTAVDVLRAVEPMHLRTAFICITAEADKSAAYAALGLGAMDYLVKSQLDPFGLVKSLAFSLFRKSKEMELRGTALHDALTGLGNRLLFREQGSKLLQQAKRARHNVAVLFMDVDGLKPVNDTYGHQVGDQLLKQVAERLKERTRESDIVARVGGDEFIILLGPVDNPAAAKSVADTITKAISQKPFLVDGHSITVGLSCGTSMFPQDSDNVDDLIRLADQRMYDIKARTKAAKHGGAMTWPR